MAPMLGISTVMNKSFMEVIECYNILVLQQLQETRQELTDKKRKLKTAETLLADAKEKNRQLEAEREKDAKERKCRRWRYRT